MAFAFAVGDSVTKPRGYPFPGVVVAAFKTIQGERRYCVECTAKAVFGMIHIFNEEQLQLKSATNTRVTESNK